MNASAPLRLPSRAITLLFVASASTSSCCRTANVEPKAAIVETRIRTPSVCAPSKPISNTAKAKDQPEPDRPQGQPGAENVQGQPAPNATLAPVQSADAPSQTSKARVEHFDCTSTLEDKRDRSLRLWDAGGPNGAAWNIDGGALLCAISVQSPCAGRAAIRLFGNARELAKRISTLSEGTNVLEIRLPAPEWQRAAISDGAPYETLLLSLGGVVFCAADPSEQYPFADAFLAGFASGE